MVLAGNRLRIPALVHEECLTGFTTYGATVYPAAIAWGATFDPDLVERMAAAIGRDMAALGVHQGLSPVLDVVRDYRWGRVEETMGEDPYLVSMLGAAYVRGLQSAGVIATLKHFAGYSASRAARNHGPVPMGRRELMDVILPPFEAAVTLAGAGSVMNSYSDVDGVPAGADPWLLTDLLRGKWGFAGTVVSDYWAVPFLATMHRVAADTDDAGAQALAAGIDVELPDTLGFGAGLVERVRRGELPEELVDRAARRLLTPEGAARPARPGLDAARARWPPRPALDLDSPANRALAREMAERSVVLLDAGTALPLLGDGRPAVRRLAVVGPCADDPRTFMGCYAFPNHVLPRHPDLGLGIEVPTRRRRAARRAAGRRGHARAGLRGAGRRTGPASPPPSPRPGTPTCAWRWSATSPACSATAPPARAATPRTCGCPACRRTCSTSCWRPARRWSWWSSPAARTRSATCTAGPPAWCRRSCPARRAVAAIAGVLSGRVQPSGKLPVQIPRRPGGQPGTYLQPPLGAESTGISTGRPDAAVPVRPRRLVHHASRSATCGSATPRCPPTASSPCPSGSATPAPGRGEEVVQLYLRDVVAQVTRPVRQLAGFARVALEPGEAADVRFRLHADRTAFTGRDARADRRARARSRCSSARPRPTCRAAARSG